MNKILIYELKRVVINWLFLAMIVVNGVYAWYILTTDIIAGIAYTAPFSGWSYCAYLGKTMPIATIFLLLIQAGYYSKKQKSVEILTFATPITPVQLLIIRSVVLGICFVLINTVIIILAFVFYILFFGYNNLEPFILPTVLIIIPCFLFSVGVGHLLGRGYQCLIYLLLLVTFVVGFCGISNVFDFFGASYFSTYPLTLAANSGGEPDFILSVRWVIVRLIYLLAGTGFMILNVKIKYKATRA